MGVFQLESGGMQDLAKQLHIDKFEEIIAVGALYRPGPMEMIPSFINRKHQRETDRNRPSLDGRYPVRDLWHHGLPGAGDADRQPARQVIRLARAMCLRRAMGKKDREEMASQREKFRQGAIEQWDR